ncbi:MAG: DUF4367 domain-containing protein [Desulfotomaculales bacterium]
MRQYTDKELDAMIKAVLRAKLDSCTPPPAEEAWARLKEKMPQKSLVKRSFRSGKRLLPGIAITAIFIFLTAAAFSLGTPKTVRAFGYKVIDGITVLLGGTEVNLRGGVVSDDATKPSPPPEEGKEIPAEPPAVVTLEQAREQAPFPLKIPGYLPEGYRLEKVLYQKQSAYTVQVEMEYKGPKEEYFTLTQFNFTGELGTGYVYDREDTIIKDVPIGPFRAKLAEHKSGFVHLMWIDGQTGLNLDGRISAREAIKIAASLYEHRDQK